MLNSTSHVFVIALGTMGLIVIVFAIISLEIYKRDKEFFIANVNRGVKEGVKQINSEAVEKNCHGLVTSRDDTSCWIVKGKMKYICRYDTLMDINENFFRAIYDIRDSEYWNLHRLSMILNEKLSENCPPFKLIQLDSTNNLLESYEYDRHDYNILNLNEVYVIPLGFLDKHKLRVCYTYPWKNFWMTNGSKLMVVFLLLLLISTCIFLFVKLLWNTKKKAENQELFIQSLNHDLKSPIAVLQLKMYQIKNSSVMPYSSEQEDLYINSLQKIGEILVSIDRLLQDSIDAKGIHLNLQVVDLQKIIKEQVRVIMAFVRDEKHVNIETSFQLSDPYIFADYHHLSRLILNLLDNAIKYSEEDVFIRICCQEEGQFVRIILQDNGYGISKPDLKHIFEKSYRIKTSGNIRKAEGFGLGLSYVYMIVKAHRGNIQVKSELGKGTTFIIKLKNGRKN